MQENTAFELSEEPLRLEPMPDPASRGNENEAGGLRDAAREEWVMH